MQLKLKQHIGILVIIISSYSCEKVIDINLNESDPQIVIEANIHNNDDDCLVKITRTCSYFSSESPEPISGAVISLANQTSEYSFSEIKEGLYQLDKIGKLIPASYTLSAEFDSVTYEATSTMPTAIHINYLSYEYKGSTLFDDAGYIVKFSFTDPEDETNYYKVRYSLNGELQNDEEDYTLLTDELFNGNSVQKELNTANRFEKGDTVSVEFMSIDENTYDYFNTLLNIIGENTMGSAAPTNPNSNFSNDALGYFSAYSSYTETIITGKIYTDY